MQSILSCIAKSVQVLVFVIFPLLCFEYTDGASHSRDIIFVFKPSEHHDCEDICEHQVGEDVVDTKTGRDITNSRRQESQKQSGFSKITRKNARPQESAQNEPSRNSDYDASYESANFRKSLKRNKNRKDSEQSGFRQNQRSAKNSDLSEDSKHSASSDVSAYAGASLGAGISGNLHLSSGILGNIGLSLNPGISLRFGSLWNNLRHGDSGMPLNSGLPTNSGLPRNSGLPSRYLWR